MWIVKCLIFQNASTRSSESLSYLSIAQNNDKKIDENLQEMGTKQLQNIFPFLGVAVTVSVCAVYVKTNDKSGMCRQPNRRSLPQSWEDRVCVDRFLENHLQITNRIGIEKIISKQIY